MKLFNKLLPTAHKTAEPVQTGEQECEQYVLELLLHHVKLMEIPQRLLRDRRYCRRLYITAFRADRATTKKQYLLDLAYLDAEIEQAQFREDFVLMDMLRSVQEVVCWGVESFRE